MTTSSLRSRSVSAFFPAAIATKGLWLATMNWMFGNVLQSMKPTLRCHSGWRCASISSTSTTPWTSLSETSGVERVSSIHRSMSTASTNMLR